MSKVVIQLSWSCQVYHKNYVMLLSFYYSSMQSLSSCNKIVWQLSGSRLAVGRQPSELSSSNVGKNAIIALNVGWNTYVHMLMGNIVHFKGEKQMIVKQKCLLWTCEN